MRKENGTVRHVLRATTAMQHMDLLYSLGLTFALKVSSAPMVPDTQRNIHVQEELSIILQVSVLKQSENSCENNVFCWIMAFLHCRTRTRIPNPMFTQYCAETFHIGSDPDSDPFPIVFV